jgi:hypothetical protein
MVKQSLIRFAAHVSIALYAALLFAEYLRPGFVSTVMNVHVMWMVIVPSVLASDVHTSSGLVKKGASAFALAILGIVLALIVWHLGDVFGAMRFWFAVVVGLTPLALYHVHR